MRSALASGHTVLGITPWLTRTPSDDVKQRLVDVLAQWRSVRFPAAEERALRATLSADVESRRAAHGRASGGDVVRAVVGGLTYLPDYGPREVLLVPAPSVRPVVVVVDDVVAHVIAYPPASPAEESSEVVLRVARALGDATRLAILAALRDGDLTSSALCAALDAPRTTLLHHLALLRAAGLLTTEVTPAGTLYSMRGAAAGELDRALRDFLGGTVR